MMATPKTILITGATGKQGGATIRALLDQKHIPVKIIAVTRSIDSGGARALAAKPNVSVIQGNLDDCDAIFKQTGDVWGVFSVQVPSNTDSKAEERQGKALIDAAVANGVKFFVYASVDRGGPERSDHDATPVPHFSSKFYIENHLKEKAATSGMEWTILRPVAFFDNLTPDIMGKVFATTWKTIPKTKSLQLVSTHDIGVYAAAAFQRPGAYGHQAISLGGDDLTFDEAREIFKSEVGRSMPTTFKIVGTMLRAGVDTVGKMFDWFEMGGYAADVAGLKRQNPDLQDFRTWLRQSSAFVTR